MSGIMRELRASAPAGLGERVAQALRELLLRVGDDTRVDEMAVDLLIADLDRRLAAQLDTILHHPQVQAIESAWRSAKRLVDRVDHHENIITEIFSCSREELFEDFSGAPEIPRSGLYSVVYNRAYGVFGGNPYGVICAAFDFGSGAEDLGLLRYCAAVAAMAHAPLIANASPSLLGLDSFADLPRLRDPAAAMNSPRLRLWRAFRATEDARYVTLALPRVLLREPYNVETCPHDQLRYRESTRHGAADLLWGYASFELTALIAASFARHRWGVYFLGSRAAAVAEQIRWTYPSLAGIWHRCPLECQVSNRIEHALADEGLTALVYQRGSGQRPGVASVLSAPSVRQPAHFVSATGGDERANVSERLGAQMPYMLLVSRIAHYLKCVERERVGSWQDRAAIERSLDRWLRNFVADQDDADWAVRARKPFRRARALVERVEGQTGWYRCRLEIQPHLTHNSASFTLSLVGKLDRPASESSR
ncbi:MAG TPA: type VI secretion system contractile sheath large subunit [Nannocystis exedens]|nr:type VI secretion system contractile sheath large subunit [Nannocystis exedens]